MSLSLQAVERLFERLTATYGREFVNRFEGLAPNAVKAAWAHELSGFAGRLADVAWALEHLPERAPNAIEFRNLCRRAPAPEVPRLACAPASQERVAQELRRLGPVLAQGRGSGQGAGARREWARRIVARHEAGGGVPVLVLKMARDALGPRREEGG